MKNGKCAAVHVTIGGLLPAPKRAEAVEAALAGEKPSAAVIDKASALVAKSVGSDVLEDIYASASYRQAMAPVYVKRALTAAFARAK
jgi:carbon-monoxide dehydrogenase medium subunit